MADVSKTVDIIFGGKNDLPGPVKAVLADIGRVESAVEKVSGPLADFAQNLLKWEAALAGVAAGGLALSIKEAGDFKDQVAEISTLTDASADQIGRFGKEILDYSRDSRKSIDDINSALYQAISLGTDYSESLDLISRAEKLAIAGKAELVDTTELLSGTLNAYGESVDQAARYSDVFFETVRLGKTTIPELADSLSKVTGLAATGKVPIETLSAALAALTATGMDTAMASTALRGIIAGIIDPTATAAKTAADLGIGFSAEALAAKGLNGVLQDVYTRTGGNIEHIAKLFENVRALNGALILGADSSGRFSEALKAMSDASGSTQAAYEKMSRNFSLINQNLLNNLKSTLITIGDSLLKTYGDTAEAISNVFKSINIAFDEGAFQDLYDELEKFGEKAIQFINDLAAALPEALEKVDFSFLLDSLKSLGVSVAHLFDGIDLTTPEGLAAAIQGVIDTMTSMVDVTRGMVKQFKPLFDFLLEGVKAFNATDTSVKELTGRIFTLAMEVEKFGVKALPILNLMADYLGPLVMWLDRVIQRLTGTLGIFWNIATFDWQGVKASWTKAFSEPVEKAGRVMKKTSEESVEWWASAASSTAKSIKKVDDALEESSRAWWKHEKVVIDHLEKVSSEELPKVADGIREIRNRQGELVHVWEDSSGIAHFKKITEAAGETAEAVERIPKNIQVELEFRREGLAEFEAETRRMSEVLDFQAKVNTAEAEVGLKALEFQSAGLRDNLESISDIFAGTGQSLNELFRMFTDPSISKRSLKTIEDQIRTENDRREEALDLQKDLTEAQIEQLEAYTEMLKLKSERLRRGESIINVSAEGLKPHLEAIMWEILEAVQIRASEEGTDLLLGLG